MFFLYPECAFYGWLWRAVKAEDELAGLGFDGPPQPAKEVPAIRAKENIRYELAKPQ